MFRIYIELADQYKIIDAASNVPKRNVLAEHLKEVITTLEQKVSNFNVDAYTTLMINSFRNRATRSHHFTTF